MKRIMLILSVICTLFIGCQRQDFKASLIFESQPAQHEGYNVGPGLYLKKGEPAKVTGYIIFIRGAEPNNFEP